MLTVCDPSSIRAVSKLFRHKLATAIPVAFIGKNAVLKQIRIPKLLGFSHDPFTAVLSYLTSEFA